MLASRVGAGHKEDWGRRAHQVDGHADLGELGVGGLELSLELGGVGGGEDGLVHLHLGHAQGLQLGQQVGVGRQQRLDRAVMVEGRRCVGWLGQANQGIRACTQNEQRSVEILGRVCCK